ncbi:Mitochondrial-processing peptidase subunit alpha, partial [Massospora cicadina]
MAGHFSAFGIYIDAGSRYETPDVAGASHMLDRIAFKSTENLTADQIKSQINAFGGNVMSHSSRETIQYQGTVYNDDLEKIVPLFAEIIQRPIFLQAELDELKQSTGYEIQEFTNNPEAYLPERLHAVAYKNNSLGKPTLCSPEALPGINSEMLRDYVQKMYTPERIVVAASGAPHDAIVELAQKHFGDMKPAAPEPPKGIISSLTSRLFSKFQPDLATATYTGGLLLEEAANAEFTQLLVALQGASVLQDEIFSLATLQMLLGGGHSFSAGGPGKGIHSRLYRTVLNRYGWSNSCLAFSHAYRDSGLFGIMGSCPSKFNLDMLHVIASSLSSVSDSTRIQDVELTRAKNQIKNNMLMNLESRLTRIEDMGQQVLLTGRCIYSSDVCQRIDSLTKQDIAGVAEKLFMNAKSPPAVIGYGQNLDALNSAHDVLA